jgi:maleylacetoacetate isomerase
MPAVEEWHRTSAARVHGAGVFMVKLYSYFRSSASYRLRIALELKRLPYEYVAVHLGRGEQLGGEFRAINPAGLVPILTDNGTILSQSLAIIEYLDELRPEPPLLPGDPAERARVRALAQTVACDIHPLNNLRVLNHLRRQFGAGDGAVNTWYHHWLSEGFGPLERMLTSASGTGRFCHHDTPTVADICLVPQLANAERAHFDLSPYPTLVRIGDACRELDAFKRAAPENQPDAE